MTKTEDENSARRFRAGILTGCCGCVLAVILVAGLWPFQAPANKVRWLTGENGLEFGHRGIVISRSAFHTVSPQGSCSLEILLQPARPDGTGTILAFDSSPNPRFPFALRQFGDALVVQRASVDARGRLVRPWLQTGHFFEAGQRVLLTVTGDAQQTVVYRNGIPDRTSAGFGLVRGDLTGHLILGSSTIRDAWSGSINGVAIYRVALSPAQVARHFQLWKEKDVFGVDPDPVPAALYRLDTRAGRVVRINEGEAGELIIPWRYQLADRVFLEPVWKPFVSRWEGGMTWSYWSDVLLNIAGFVPVGFFCTARFASTRPLARAGWMGLLLGFCISLAIETTQYFLPTRDSSMTDLLTNTIGTAVGAASARPAVLKRLSNLLECAVHRVTENSNR